LHSKVPLLHGNDDYLVLNSFDAMWNILEKYMKEKKSGRE
jgi:hypothetical protein